MEQRDAEASRGPGRPRSAEADRAIVEATLEMIADDGYHALSMEAVATAAGVGKATVYRRWPGKRELVADALATLNDGLVPLPAPGPTRERARVLMEHVSRKEHTSLSGRIMPRMMAYRSSHPELFEDYVARVIEPRRERMRTVLRQGVERGDVRGDLTIELAAQALTAPLLMLRMASSSSQQLPPTTVDDLLDIVWPGVCATG